MRSRRTRFPAWLPLLLGFTPACSDSPTDPPGPAPGPSVTITGAPDSSRQGDVVTFTAEVRDAGGSLVADAVVSWSVEPADAGFIDSDGRFVGYAPGPATIMATASGASDEASIVVSGRDLSGSLRVVGVGPVDQRFTSDLWLYGGFAYTGTWGTRQVGAEANRGNRLYTWNVSNPTAPLLIDSLVVAAGTVNDVKIRSDGALAVLTREGSFPNGITLLDTSDPLHPVAVSEFTERLEPGVHNAWIEGDFVYVVSDGTNPDAGSGLNVVDVSDPAGPELVASFFGGTPGVATDFLHDVYVRDGLAFLSHWDVGLVILDVGNGVAGGSPSNPVEVSRIRTAGGQVHNAWYWPATGYVFVGEEDFSTPGIVHVVNASDLSNPREVATYRVDGSTPHNFWVDEERGILLVGWYTEGLHAIDVTGELLGQLELQGREIASLKYNGSGLCSSGVGTCTWAPQLHNGLVWVSDLNSGLWALELEVGTGG